MQIPASFVRTSSFFAGRTSNQPVPTAPAPEPAAAPAADGSAPADVPVRLSEAGPLESLRQTLEDFFRAGLSELEDEQGEVAPKKGHHHDGRHEVRRAVHDIRHEVKHGLKDLSKELRQRVGNDDEVNQGDEEIRALRHDIKNLGKEFDHALKHIEHDVGRGSSIEPGALLEAVQAEFETLFSGLASVLSGPQEPAAEPATEPAPVSQGIEIISVEPFELPTTLEAPVVAKPDPVEPPTAVEDPPPTESSVLSTKLHEMLASILEQFESLFAGIQEAFAAPAAQPPVDGAGEQEPEETATVPTPNRFEFAIDAYLSIRFEVSGSSIETFG